MLTLNIIYRNLFHSLMLTQNEQYRCENKLSIPIFEMWGIEACAFVAFLVLNSKNTLFYSPLNSER